MFKTSVIRANLKTGVLKNKARQIFRKNEHFLSPDTHTYVSGGKKCSLGVLCFIETPLLRFALLHYYRQKLVLSHNKFFHK